MSNFSVGKIVNNSATLILNSDDPKALKFSKTIPLNETTLSFKVSARVSVKEFPPVSTPGSAILNDRWFDYIFGLDNSATEAGAPTVVEGEYWVVTAYNQEIAAQSDWSDVTDLTDAELTQLENLVPVNKLGFIVQINATGTLSAQNRGYKLGVQTIGYTDTIDNHITDWSNFADFSGKVEIIDHTKFHIDLQNIVGYPCAAKSRCLVKCVGLHMSTPDTRGSENESYYENTLNLFVKIPQLAPINYYIGGQQGTGCIQVVHANRNNNLTGSSNILDGVLCQSPFGKRLEVSIDFLLRKDNRQYFVN
eukprot:SAG31_NODE_9701_length_1240_cov_1.299737_1_plen_306_part_01